MLTDLDLEDFWRHPGWDVAFDRLAELRRDLLDKAARAVGDDHLVKLGELRGCEAVLAALTRWQRVESKEPSRA